MKNYDIEKEFACIALYVTCNTSSTVIKKSNL